MANTADLQLQTMIDNMMDKTGKPLADWFAVLAASGLEKHGDMMKLLKGEHQVTHGFANTIVLLYRQQAAGEPPAEADLVAAQYASRAALRPIYEAVVAVAMQFGDDVEIAPKKTYVSLRRSKQFAIVKPSTKSRVDVGLNLKGVGANGRLANDTSFGGMCSHCVPVTDVAEVDDELVGWLRQAYEMA